MDEYIQEILDVLWEIDDWPKDMAMDMKNVRKLIKEFEPDQIDLVKLAHDMDWWLSINKDAPHTVKTLRGFALKAFARGEAKPYRLTINGAVESVEEQLRQKDLRRKADLRRLGLDN